MEQKSAPEPSFAEAFCSAVLIPEFWFGLEEQRPVHLLQASPCLPGLMGLDDVIAAITRGGESGAACAYKGGEPYMRENIFLAYLDQATLSLANAEQYLRPLLHICQGLTPTFDYVTAQLVLDPPDCRGPPVLTESDTLFLHLWGERRLTLRRPISRVPVTAPRPGVLLAPDMQPGDVLFVPAGVECQVTDGLFPQAAGGTRVSASSSEPVLYAMLTLRPSELSFEASLGQFLTDLLYSGQFSAQADGFFRSAVMKHSLPDRYLSNGSAELDAAPRDSRREALEEELRRSADELASQLGAANIRRHFATRMEALREAQQKGAEELLEASPSAGPRPPAGIIQAHNWVSVSKGIVCQCHPGSDTACFKRGSETLTLPIVRSASHLINRLSNGKPHIVSSLPCTDPMERLCVCQILVLKGCLAIAEGPADTE